MTVTPIVLVSVGVCLPPIASNSLHSCPREADLCLREDIVTDVLCFIVGHRHYEVMEVLYAHSLGVRQADLCALLDVFQCSDTFLVPLVCSGCATAVDGRKELRKYV